MSDGRNVFWAVMFFLMGSPAFAQTSSVGKIPEGMEAVSVGNGSALLVPKGAIIKRNGSHVTVESDSEYMGRRFSVLEGRLRDIYKRQQALNGELKKLADLIQELQERYAAQTCPQGQYTKADIKLLRAIASILQSSSPTVAHALNNYAEREERLLNAVIKEQEKVRFPPEGEETSE